MRINQTARERWPLFAKTSAFLAWSGRDGGGGTDTHCDGASQLLAPQLRFSTASFRLKAEMGTDEFNSFVPHSSVGIPAGSPPNWIGQDEQDEQDGGESRRRNILSCKSCESCQRFWLGEDGDFLTTKGRKTRQKWGKQPTEEHFKKLKC
jgi:hypothetical protein